MNFNDYDLIVTTDYIKRSILRKNTGLLRAKVINLNSLKELLLGYVHADALHVLCRDFSLDINTAEAYLKNIYFLDDYYKHLISKDLIQGPEKFKYKNILLINVKLDKYLEKLLENVSVSKYLYKEQNNHHLLYSFKNIFDEVSFIGEKISELLEKEDINKIKIVNKSSDYDNFLKLIFSFYNIPINIGSKEYLYQSDDVQSFLNVFKKTRDVKESLKNIKDEFLKEKIINIFNRYSFSEFDKVSLSIIDRNLKKITRKKTEYINAVECINYNDVFSEDNYYFFINFNETEFPKNYKDDDFFSDREKKILGIKTSMEKNMEQKEVFKNIFAHQKNMIFTYKENSESDELRVSYLANEFDFQKERGVINYNFSDDLNKIILSEKLDNYILFNEKSEELERLFSTYNSIPYLEFDNKYKQVKREIVKPYLSYTSLNDYYICSFKYYLKYILKLDNNKNNLNFLVGNFFHNVLEKMFEEGFSLDTEIKTFLSNEDLDLKSKFYLTLLIPDLKRAYESILKEKDFISLDETLTELDIKIEEKNFSFRGKIDKVLYQKNSDKSLAIIIDYKTGKIINSLDNINYGFNMQLPIYMYLLNRYDKTLSVKGIYYKPLILEKTLDTSEEDLNKGLRLVGYSTSDESVLREIDSEYENSQIIKSMTITEKGTFGAHAKVLSDEEFDKLNSIVSSKIEECSKKIKENDFQINPKKIDSKNVGCDNCEYKDICFVKEEDYIYLEKKSFKEILENELY